MCLVYDNWHEKQSLLSAQYTRTPTRKQQCCTRNIMLCDICCFGYGSSLTSSLEDFYTNKLFSVVSTFRLKSQCSELQTVSNNTGVARERYIFVMSTVMTAPAVVSTLCDTCLHTVALNVVHPNPSTTGTVQVTNKSSTVSVCNTQMIITDVTVLIDVFKWQTLHSSWLRSIVLGLKKIRQLVMVLE